MPATPPPSTEPSDPAKDTLKPPVLLRLPLFSENKYEPDKEIISNRPCQKEKQLCLDHMLHYETKTLKLLSIKAYSDLSSIKCVHIYIYNIT